MSMEMHLEKNERRIRRTAVTGKKQSNGSKGEQRPRYERHGRRTELAIDPVDIEFESDVLDRAPRRWVFTDEQPEEVEIDVENVVVEPIAPCGWIGIAYTRLKTVCVRPGYFWEIDGLSESTYGNQEDVTIWAANWVFAWEVEFGPRIAAISCDVSVLPLLRHTVALHHMDYCKIWEASTNA